MTDANQLLREDHRKVKQLFQEFEQESDSRRKLDIANKAIEELDIHTKIEEDIYYPAVGMQSNDEAADLVAEAAEEHEIVKRLADQLKRRRSVDDDYEAKFKVMAENVKHHIEEEEMQMLPMAAEEGMDRLRELGQEMQMEKARLMNGAMAGSNGRVRRSPSRSRSTARRATTGRRSGTKSTGRTTARRRAGTSSGTTNRRRAATGTKSRSTGTWKRPSSTSRSTGTTTRSRSRSASSAGRTLSRSRGKSPRSSSAGRTLSQSRSRSTTASGRKRSTATRSASSAGRTLGRSRGKSPRSSAAGRTLSRSKGTRSRSRSSSTARKR